MNKSAQKSGLEKNQKQFKLLKISNLLKYAIRIFLIWQPSKKNILI